LSRAKDQFTASNPKWQQIDFFLHPLVVNEKIICVEW
jgi:hypothetical protein